VNHTSSNIEIDRPLTSEEHSVVQWLLEHGGEGNAKFLEQLGRARVASLCGCGCASIDFAVSGKRPDDLTMRTLSDYQWRDDHGHLFGAYVFEQDGLLAGLDLWSIDGQSTPTAMPPIARLVPLSAAQV
jgi:hypothetical protein